MRFKTSNVSSGVALLLLAAASNSFATSASDLTELSIAELMNLEITSVSKKPQTLANAAAAAFVITQEDIRRSGATTIPDILRMVPGLQVARIDANKWAVSIRGFNNRVANKLLVLKDGRSIYTAAFSGVYWEQQDTPLELIERIEVIRGPGAALWGANAVNGVINIITKQAADSKGGIISAGSGTAERGFGVGSYGFSLNEDIDIRLYSKYANKAPGEQQNGSNTHDGWQSGSVGFRIDNQLSDMDRLTVHGDFSKGSYDESGLVYQLPTFSDPRYSYRLDTKASMLNGNLVVDWERSLSETDSISFKGYYDYYQNNFYSLDEQFHTVDFELQHRFSFAKYHDFIWGINYRFIQGELIGNPGATQQISKDSNNLFSFYMHDEISLVPDKLALILGSRFEHNDYTGFEIQPNARLLWTPTTQHSAWAAVSRAVRTPAITDRLVQYSQFRTMSPLETGLPLPLRLQMNTNKNQQSEAVVAYELGYRTLPLQNVSLDVALFYNQYNKLRSAVTGSLEVEPSILAPNNLVQNYNLTNSMHGHTYGFELSATWTPVEWWRLQASYSCLFATMYLDADPNGQLAQLNKSDTEGSAPKHQGNLRSGFDIGKHVELDLWLRAVGDVPDIMGQTISGYFTMDARVAWKPLKTLELSLVGQNLLQPRHQEYANDIVWSSSSEVPRGVYGKVTWKF